MAAPSGVEREHVSSDTEECWCEPTVVKVDAKREPVIPMGGYSGGGSAATARPPARVPSAARRFRDD